MTERDREILALFEAGNQRGLARAISRAESGAGAALMHALFGRTGRALTIGLTGPPGVGKSTLSSALVKTARAAGKSVGVVSVDPSSPFSHGAILGDRIRLTEHFVDPEVFIRSMASRGHLGGLAGATGDAVAFMDAFGKDVILIETVGVGQSEIEIAELADTTIVAMQPGSGDSVQLLKAGVLEVADVFVVNKADHPMALVLRREIRSMMEMLDFSGWVPPLVSTQADEGVGIGELWDAILAHDAYLRESGDLAGKRRAAFAHRVRALVMGELQRRVESRIEAALDENVRRGDDPYETAAKLLAPLREALPPADDDSPSAQIAPGRATVKGL
ncbi:MAG: methylmalonyl Co-A mutase-associated GTPase MeaB [Candidatus Eremiobacteraeota bacterium]|nr:methylmalonyl Co-A mutase-associated GTPase MeaB [Candidatus Eremiobacteraeota bacterium]